LKGALRGPGRPGCQETRRLIDACPHTRFLTLPCRPSATPLPPQLLRSWGYGRGEVQGLLRALETALKPPAPPGDGTGPAEGGGGAGAAEAGPSCAPTAGGSEAGGSRGSSAGLRVGKWGAAAAAVSSRARRAPSASGQEPDGTAGAGSSVDSGGSAGPALEEPSSRPAGEPAKATPGGVTPSRGPNAGGGAQAGDSLSGGLDAAAVATPLGGATPPRGPSATGGASRRATSTARRVSSAATGAAAPAGARVPSAGPPAARSGARLGSASGAGPSGDGGGGEDAAATWAVPAGLQTAAPLRPGSSGANMPSQLALQMEVGRWSGPFTARGPMDGRALVEGSGQMSSTRPAPRSHTSVALAPPFPPAASRTCRPSFGPCASTISWPLSCQTSQSPSPRRARARWPAQPPRHCWRAAAAAGGAARARAARRAAAAAAASSWPRRRPRAGRAADGVAASP
jgi:hypothetical protein